MLFRSGDNTGVALTFINADDCYNFSKIETLIGNEVKKLSLPDGFDPGPAYDTKPRKHGFQKKRFVHKKRNMN